MKIRIGSRESKLAIAQTSLIIRKMKEASPEIEFELITMKTTGDKILDRTLDKIGGKGLFVKELDWALKEKKIDLAVHSLKDMPMEEDAELPILAVSEREDPRDVLILPKGIAEIDFSKPIGTSSKRRMYQIKNLFPKAEVFPVRGNVLTRLDKLDNGEYSALILAYAGIKRLGLEERISQIFSVEEMVPAACQGVLVIQGRRDFDTRFLKSVHDPLVYKTSLAERGFVRVMEGGCTSPVAAYAEIQEETLKVTGFDISSNGEIIKVEVRGNLENPEKLGHDLANKMKEKQR